MRVRPGHKVRDVLLGHLSTRLAYQYEPLPSPHAIRLLQLRPSSNDGELHCSLKAFDQGTAPPYHCLSYTWRYPLTSFSELPQSSSSLLRPSILRKVAATAPNPFIREGKSQLEDQGILSDGRHLPISCDGKTMLVTANLYDALRTLRSVDSTVPSSQPALQNDKYFWIDAMCVDQANITERNTQVAMMGHTFREAQSVLIWLGAEDQFVSDALELIEALASLPQSKRDATKYTDFFDPRWHASAGNLLLGSGWGSSGC